MPFVYDFVGIHDLVGVGCTVYVGKSGDKIDLGLGYQTSSVELHRLSKRHNKPIHELGRFSIIETFEEGEWDKAAALEQARIRECLDDPRTRPFLLNRNLAPAVSIANCVKGGRRSKRLKKGLFKLTAKERSDAAKLSNKDAEYVTDGVRTIKYNYKRKAVMPIEEFLRLNPTWYRGRTLKSKAKKNAAERENRLAA
jgi:hypothetical protein